MSASFAVARSFQDIVVEALQARLAPFVWQFSKGKSVLRVIRKAPEVRASVVYAEVRATFADPVWGGSKPARLIAEIRCQPDDTANVVIWFSGCGTTEGQPLSLYRASEALLVTSLPGALAHLERWMNERRADVD